MLKVFPHWGRWGIAPSELTLTHHTLWETPQKAHERPWNEHSLFPTTTSQVPDTHAIMKSLNVGHVEHVHQIRLPLASSDDAAIEEAADEATRMIYESEDVFTCFPRLPVEIRKLIWEATFEPSIFRAWMVAPDEEYLDR